MKRFCTLFLSDDSRVLAKDPGMIPYYMHNLGYESTLASFINQDGASAYSELLEGVKMDFLGERKLPQYPQHQMACREALRYIRANAASIDVLHLFFIKHSMLYGVLYKLLNHKGKLYVKADLDIDAYIAADYGIKAFFRRLVFRFYCSKVADLVTVESTRGVEYLSRTLHPGPGCPAYLPDGVDDRFFAAEPSWEEKKNVILYAGRIGTRQKNTEMMLEACRSVNWKEGWKLVLAGAVEESFKPELDKFIKESGVGGNIEAVGEIRDRKQMAELYARASVFCLTSRFESFGLVCVEAMAYGDYLIMTPVCTAEDFIGGGGGEIVKDASELAAAVNRLIENPETIKNNLKPAAARAASFRWSVICRRLSEMLG